MYENQRKAINSKFKKKGSINLKKLQENVSNLDKLEQLEIFRIIKKYDNKLTENKNGIFINLSYLSSHCIEEISNFVCYSLDNKQRLNKIELMSQDILKNSILNKQYREYNTNINLKTPENKKDESLNKDVNSDKKMQFISIGHNKENVKNYTPTTNYSMELDDIMENLSDNDIEEETKQNEINQLIHHQSKPEETEPIKLEYTSKKKYTGKRGRIYKKCRELNKSYQNPNLVSYENFNNDLVEMDQNDDMEEDFENTNELMEEKI